MCVCVCVRACERARACVCADTYIDDEKWVARGTVSLEFGWDADRSSGPLELWTLD